MPLANWSENAGRALAMIMGVVALVLCVVGAPDAFAQASGNSTVSGTVVDRGASSLARWSR